MRDGEEDIEPGFYGVQTGAKVMETLEGTWVVREHWTVRRES